MIPSCPRRHVLVFALGVAAMLAVPGAAAQRIEEMSVTEARDAVAREEMVLVDIRTPEEWRETGIPDVAEAMDMRERSFVSSLLELRRQYPERKLGIICAYGVRSRVVANFLVKNGVRGIVDVPAGLMKPRRGWLAKKLPLRAPGEPVVAVSP